MKKTILMSLILTTTSILSSAQVENPIKKGNSFFGGFANFDKKVIDIKNDNNITSKKEWIIEISPIGGFFFQDRTALGLHLNYTLNLEKWNKDPDSYGYRSLLLSPFIKYYLFSSVFGEANFGYGYFKIDEFKGPISQFRFGLGYSAFLNEKTCLEPVISYSKTRVKTNMDEKYIIKYETDFNFSLSFIFFF